MLTKSDYLAEIRFIMNGPLGRESPQDVRFIGKLTFCLRWMIRILSTDRHRSMFAPPFIVQLAL